MSTDIERLLYYERQYLRSFDFTAEQTYHLEMRRRLNLALHLWGIVEGLELLKGEVVQGAPDQFYLSEGMAIDAYGREIIVSAKHLLSRDLETNKLTGAGTYSVWIGYTREPATPPEAAYQRCDLKDQYTRWREYFEIVLRSIADNPNPTEDPDPFGDLGDDPATNRWLIHLGTINIDRSLNITAATNVDRVYIGLRAQRIVAPRKATPAEFQFLGPSPTQANTPWSPLTSIAVEDNLFLDQNLIAGQDFAIDPQKIQPPPASSSPPDTLPSSTGNVKIAGDLFLQGNLYTHCDPTQPDLWLNLDHCIRERILNSVPEVHIGTAPLQFAPVGQIDSSGTVSVSAAVSITTQLAQVDPSLTAITASIASLHWLPSPQTVIGSPPSSPPNANPLAMSMQVRSSLAASTHPASAPSATDGLKIDTSGQVALVSGSTYTATLTCSVAPAYLLPSSGTTMYQVPIDFVLISYVVIFYPKTS